MLGFLIFLRNLIVGLVLGWMGFSGSPADDQDTAKKKALEEPTQTLLLK